MSFLEINREGLMNGHGNERKAYILFLSERNGFSTYVLNCK